MLIPGDTDLEHQPDDCGGRLEQHEVDGEIMLRLAACHDYLRLYKTQAAGPT